MCLRLVATTYLGLSLGLMLSGSAAAQDVVQDPSLLGWWKLDESFGIIAKDSSGNGNHGTLVGDPSWTSGFAGGAVLLDGVDDFIEIPHDESLVPPGTQARRFPTFLTGNPSLPRENRVSTPFIRI